MTEDWFPGQSSRTCWGNTLFMIDFQDWFEDSKSLQISKRLISLGKKIKIRIISRTWNDAVDTRRSILDSWFVGGMKLGGKFWLEGQRWHQSWLLVKANNSACTSDGKFCSKDFDLSVSLQGFCHSLVPLWKYSFVFYDRIERHPVASLVRDLCWSKQYLVFALPPLGRLLFSDFTIGDKYIFGMLNISLLTGTMTMIMNIMTLVVMMMMVMAMTMLYLMTTVVMRMIAGFSSFLDNSLCQLSKVGDSGQTGSQVLKKLWDYLEIFPNVMLSNKATLYYHHY